MAIRWKDNPIKEDMNIPLWKLRLNPARKYVEKKEKWCPHCNNAETNVMGIKRFSKIINSEYSKYIIKVVRENNLSRFDIKALLNIIDRNRIFTDGALQRKSLAVMTAVGIFKKEIIEYENKKGEKKFKYVFNLNEPVIIPSCYDSIKDKHRTDIQWRETKYF